MMRLINPNEPLSFNSEENELVLAITGDDVYFGTTPIRYYPGDKLGFWGKIKLFFIDYWNYLKDII